MPTGATARDATRRIVGVNEVAEYLGLTVPAVRSRVYRNEIDHIRVSERCVRFDLDDIDKWLDANKVRATS
jgi:excisionase family DNA binding protein